ncbi:MAG: glycosyltransferase, partial [Hydrogenophaga sp.]|nr:glycosyltransferase [Hydrogenophaga sp.]
MKKTNTHYLIITSTLLSLAACTIYAQASAVTQSTANNIKTASKNPSTTKNESLWPEQKKALMARPKKIVGLVPVRNEEQYIDQCLRALALYTDAIIVLDDVSTDNTVAIVESLAKECHIERIIKKTIWFRDEPGDRNKMLQAGREIGGTHFISLDADEMFTAPCKDNNFLRNKILSMEPGDRMKLLWINLWKNVSHFWVDTDENNRTVGDMRRFIFCDDGFSEHQSDFIHTQRYPANLGYQKGKDFNIT